MVMSFRFDQKNTMAISSTLNDIFYEELKELHCFDKRHCNWKYLTIESLLLQNDRLQLKRFGHVSRMPQQRIYCT